MGFLTGDIGATKRGDTDDFWYSNLGIKTASGARVTADRAMRTSAVFACVRVLAESIGQLPLHMYERVADGKRAVPNHLLEEVLAFPNAWMAGGEFRELMQGHASLRGNAFALIELGPRGLVSDLWPQHPDSAEVDVLEGRRLRYTFKEPETVARAAQKYRYSQEEVFHLRGLSADGVLGLSPIAMMRESVGIALAAEEYGARFFQNDATGGLVIEHPGSFKDVEAIKRFKAGWQEQRTGVNRHKTAVLEGGAKVSQIGLTNKDSQFLESRKFQIADVARAFRVPLHMINELDRATNNNIEHQSLEFVVHTLGPWLVKWEQAISRQLIGDRRRYFAEFLVDGLLRGDVKSRYEAYSTGINTGFLTRNEVRRKENYNPLDGLDEPLRPLNMTPEGQSEDVSRETAIRLVSEELSELRAAYSPDRIDAFIKATREIYSIHAKKLQESLGLSQLASMTYCEVGRQQIKESQDIPALLDNWEKTRAAELALFSRSFG